MADFDFRENTIMKILLPNVPTVLYDVQWAHLLTVYILPFRHRQCKPADITQTCLYIYTSTYIYIYIYSIYIVTPGIDILLSIQIYRNTNIYQRKHLGLPDTFQIAR